MSKIKIFIIATILLISALTIASASFIDDLKNKINVNPLSMISGESIYTDHKIIVYITDDLDETYVKNKLNIAMNRLAYLTKTSWTYDIKKINSIHKDWNIGGIFVGELPLFWTDVYNQVDLKNDFQTYNHYIIITSKTLNYNSAHIIIRICKSSLDHTENSPNSVAVIEHEILHEYGMKDSTNWGCISNGQVDTDNKINLCGITLTNRNDKIDSYEAFLWSIGISGKLISHTNNNDMYAEIDGYSPSSDKVEYHSLLYNIYQDVTPGLRTIKYMGKTETINIKPYESQSIFLTYTTTPPPPPPCDNCNNNNFIQQIINIIIEFLRYMGIRL